MYNWAYGVLLGIAVTLVGITVSNTLVTTTSTQALSLQLATIQASLVGSQAAVKALGCPEGAQGDETS